jgi:hypothetical protein
MDRHAYRFFSGEIEGLVGSVTHDIVVLEDFSAAATTFASSAARRAVSQGETALSTYVWPSSILLAQYISEHDELVCGKRVMELGCGSGLVGLTVLKLQLDYTAASTHHPASVAASSSDTSFTTPNQSHTTMTDIDLRALELVRMAAEMSFPSASASLLSIATCDWTSPYQDVFADNITSPTPSSGSGTHTFDNYWRMVRSEIRRVALPSSEAESATTGSTGTNLPDTILAADALFDSSLFEPVINSIAILLHAKRQSPDGPHDPCCIIAYHVRSITKSIQNLLTHFDLIASILEPPRLAPMQAKFLPAMKTPSDAVVPADTVFSLVDFDEDEILLLRISCAPASKS